MRKILPLFVASLIVSSACADTKNYIAEWANSWSSSSSWDNGVPSSTDDAVFDFYTNLAKPKSISYGYCSTLVGSQLTSVNDLTIQNLYYINDSSVKKSANIEVRFSNNSSSVKTFNVLGNLNFKRSIGGGSVIIGKVEGNTSDANRISPIISIGGNLNIGDPAEEIFSETSSGYSGSFSIGNGVATEYTGWNGSPQKLYVGGNVNIYGSNNLYFNTDVGTLSRQAGDISDPDIVIGGTVSMVAAVKYSYPSWYINARGDSHALNTVVQLGGLGHSSNGDKQNGNVRIKNPSTGTNTATMIFTNAENTITTYIGLISDTSINNTTGAVSTAGKLKIVMDGLGTQIFRASYQPENNFFTGGVLVKNGTILFYNKGINSLCVDQTLAPIGDVEIQGGRIGAIASSGAAVGSFWAGNLYWAGIGKILVDFNAASCDLIHFKGDLYKDSSLGFDEYAFEFVNLSDVTDGLQYKLVTFDGISEFVASDFSSNAELLGKKAIFSMDNNNIYVEFASIPEQATIASLLGVLALGLAIYRRRK